MQSNSKQPILTAQAPAPGGAYSQGLRVGNIVVTAGLRPVDPATGEVVGTTIEEQTAAVLTYIQAVLEAGGATMADVVKTTVHLSDLSLFPRFNAVYADHFPDPKPVRTTVGSELGDVLVEIDAMAVVPEGR